MKRVGLLLFIMMAMEGKKIETFYGSFDVTEPILVDVIESSAMQRLKKIHQYGIDHYVLYPDQYTRYNHSLGVWALLHIFGASLEEQLSGLVHDATHTVFSHVGDYLFAEYSKKQSIQTSSAYQDEQFEQIMHYHGMDTILAPYGLTIQVIDPHCGAFHLLEAELPDICADRLEYNLQGGYHAGLLTQADIALIIADLRYDQGRWYFVNPATARTFARLPLQLMISHWSHPFGMLVDHLAAGVLRSALECSGITLEMVHHDTDDKMWQRLQDILDPLVRKKLHELCLCSALYRLSSVEDYDIYVRGKFRGIDPWVLCNGLFCRLTECDAEFAKEFAVAKKVVEQGWYLKKFSK